MYIKDLAKVLLIPETHISSAVKGDILQTIDYFNCPPPHMR